VTRNAETTLTFELGDWIVSQLPTTLDLAAPSTPMANYTALRVSERPNQDCVKCLGGRQFLD
jgi:hypothetical protein